MTEAQKESLKFYTTNDYLLINGILWGESQDTIDTFINIINKDGLEVIKETVEMGFDVRWNCSKEDGEKLYNVYMKRFPIIDSADVKKQIICRAQNDTVNMMTCLEPLTTDLVLYRNIRKEFINNIKEGKPLNIWDFRHVV